MKSTAWKPKLSHVLYTWFSLVTTMLGQETFFALISWAEFMVNMKLSTLEFQGSTIYARVMSVQGIPTYCLSKQ